MSRAMRMLGLAAAVVATAYVASTLRSNPPGALAGPHPDRGETARPPQSRGELRTNPGTSVYALARLEPAGGLIVVGARPGIRVERVLVAVGDLVKAGQPLAILEGREEAARRLALAEAQKVAAL